MSNGLLQRVTEIRHKAPAARRAILEVITGARRMLSRGNAGQHHAA